MSGGKNRSVHSVLGLLLQRFDRMLNLCEVRVDIECLLKSDNGAFRVAGAKADLTKPADGAKVS